GLVVELAGLAPPQQFQAATRVLHRRERDEGAEPEARAQLEVSAALQVQELGARVPGGELKVQLLALDVAVHPFVAQAQPEPGLQRPREKAVLRLNAQAPAETGAIEILRAAAAQRIRRRRDLGQHQ